MGFDKNGWFSKSFYGMFVHYGLYSILGRGCLGRERIPPVEYRKLADRFIPDGLDTNCWARLAADAGMRYMCLTTRHSDGFALWDSGASDFNSVKTACGRDLVGEYVSACRRHNLRVGLYYHVKDFVNGRLNDPDDSPGQWREFVSVVHEQLVELMTDYGKIDYLFYDGCPPPETWGCAEINAKIRELQPEILISDRCGLDEDVKSAEQHIIKDPGKLWESCMTINENWGWDYTDNNWKSPQRIIRTLFLCAHNGGNLLLNVGPRLNGSVQEEPRGVLGRVREWLEKNGEALFGVDPHPFNYATGLSTPTARKNTAYIPLIFYYGPDTVMPGIGNGIESVRVLSTNEEIKFKKENGRLFFSGLPKTPPDELLTVLALELDGEPEGVKKPY